MISLKEMRRCIGSALAGGLIALVLVNVIALPTKQAEALLPSVGGEIVFDPTNFVKNTITSVQSAITAGLQNQEIMKEFVFDDIAFKLAKKVLAQTTSSLIDWINSGFEGKPAFITNLNDYLLTAADQVAGEFLQDSTFAYLCQPLQMPVQIIVNNYYARSRSWQEQTQCTLSGAQENINDFLSGNFENGGWSQWFRMVSSPQNNVYTASAIAIDTLNQTTAGAQENAKTEADWSNGWLSVKDCSTGKCITVTPGNVISEYLNFKLTVGDRTLIEADEINEVMGALFNQLGNQALMGVGGLLGMSYSPDGTSPSYLQDLETEVNVYSQEAGDSKFIDEAIRIETKYLAIHEKGLTDLEKLEDELAACTGDTSKLEDDIEKAIEEYTEIVGDSTALVGLLATFKNEFDTTDSADYKTEIVNLFLDIKGEGLLHDESDIEIETQEIAKEVVDLQTKADVAGCTADTDT